MTNTVVWSDLDTNKMIYESPKRQNDGYMSDIYYKFEEKDRLMIQTPKLQSNDGIVTNKSGRQYLNVVLDDQEFLNLLKKIDEKNVILTTQYSKEWFGKEMPMKIVDNYYRTPLTNNDSGSTMKFRVYKKEDSDDLDTDLFNKNESVDLKTFNELLENENNKVIAMVQLIGLKFLKRQFIPEWKLIQAKIYEKKEVPYMFTDDTNYNSDDDYLVPDLSDEEETEIDDLDILLTNRDKQNEEKNNLLEEINKKEEELNTLREKLNNLN